MAPVQRSADPLRRLSAMDLDIGAAPAIKEHSSNQPDDPPLPDDHPLLAEVEALLEYFGGVIFTGPPGTSKSYYAAKVGTKLSGGDPGRIRFVQFHPSYQYEDFMEGYVPVENGEGFKLKPKHFLELCELADNDRTNTYVLVIDELSRGDAGRVFGEALTYVERSKRDLEFELASGGSTRVPPNLVILATMNPLDRGVDEVDAAFERRFAKIAMDPDADILAEMLELNEIEPALRTGIIQFFNFANQRAKSNPQGTIGHTYFGNVRGESTLQSVWDHQLRFLVEKAYRLDPDTRNEIENAFADIALVPGAAVDDAQAADA